MAAPISRQNVAKCSRARDMYDWSHCISASGQNPGRIVVHIEHTLNGLLLSGTSRVHDRLV
jgi:hypothetical protein